MANKCNLVLNLSGMHCPYSMLKVNATFRDMKAGVTAEILGDRPSLVEEIERWCEGTGNRVVSVETGEAEGAVRVRLVVRKA